MKSICVYLTLDADQDRSTGLCPSQALPSWDGFRLIPRIHSLLTTRQWPYTVFVRCDRQIEECEGNSLAVYLRNQALWDCIRSDRCEIGWHPHLYVRTPHEGCSQIRRVSGDLQNAGIHFDCVRLGEAWHSNQTMTLLAEIGYRVDSSAIPGRKRQDGTLAFDWEPTPNRPYYPFHSDYRTGEYPRSPNTLPLLEVPMTTALIRTHYDDRPLRRYLNPCFHTQLFQEGVQTFLAHALTDSVTDEVTMVLTFHPGELLDHAPDGLCAFNWAALERNLDFLQSVLERSRLDYGFHTAIEATFRE